MTISIVPANDLSAQLEPIRVAGKLPALAGAVWRGKDLLALGAAGWRHEGGDARVAADDRWHLGSDTKAMTAVLIAIYIDRAKLRWDDTLGALFGAGLNPGYAGVTLTQLLEHRGGMPGEIPPDISADMRRAPADPATRQRAVRAMLAATPAKPPGTFLYANAGYMTLGVALELATGKAWEDLMRADLFGPLGMTTCGFGAPPGESPWGHRGSEPVPPGPDADNPPALGPAGTVHCSLRDWGKFLAVVLAGVRGEPTVASAPTMTRLLTPPEAPDGQPYAGGWLFTSRPWGGGTVLTHSGSNTMWTATAWLAPKKNLAFAAVANRFDAKAVDSAFSVLIPPYTK